MTEMSAWTRADEDSPEQYEKVEVITEGGDQRELVFYNGLWFLPDMSMYVYFAPAFWRRKEN